jgi:hypothetical protein
MKHRNRTEERVNKAMKQHNVLLTALLLSIVLSQQVSAQRSWTFNLSFGDAWCFNMPLSIEQEGYDRIKLQAHYRTEAFKLPVYYSVRTGTARDKKGWELELTHLKIILDNNPPEVEQFEVSHGYNYVTVNRTWDIDLLILRFGLGTIIAHPESIVRGKWYDNHQGLFNRGYHFAGPAIQFAAEKEFIISGGLFVDLEIKAAVATARVGIADGHAIVPQAGFHGLVGIGYTFK